MAKRKRSTAKIEAARVIKITVAKLRTVPVGRVEISCARRNRGVGVSRKRVVVSVLDEDGKNPVLVHEMESDHVDTALHRMARVCARDLAEETIGRLELLTPLMTSVLARDASRSQIFDARTLDRLDLAARNLLGLPSTAEGPDDEADDELELRVERVLRRRLGIDAATLARMAALVDRVGHEPLKRRLGDVAARKPSPTKDRP